jgi:type IV pilus assembly protein PilC
MVSKDLAAFTRQFSVMIDAGVPLVQALDLIARSQDQPRLAAAISAVRLDVEAGSTLAVALRRHPDVWDDFYTMMVEAGEAGGILDTILQRLSAHIENEIKLTRALKSATVYPASVVGASAAGTVVLFALAVPAARAIDIAAPESTRLASTLLEVSRVVTGDALTLLVVIGLVAVAVPLFHRTTAGRSLLDRWALRLPLFGPFLRNVLVVRFARSLSMLISSGVPILDACTITANSTGNRVFEQATLDVKRGIEQGQTIAEPLERCKAIPPMLALMIGVGEQTGALEIMLNKVADFYEHEVDATVASLFTPTKIVLLVLIGLAVGGVALWW